MPSEPALAGVSDQADRFAGGADLIIAGMVDKRYALGSARIGGNLADAAWRVVGVLNSLKVGGSAIDSTIRADGSMNSITLGASSGSDFLAGIAASAARHAAVAADFLSVQTIKKFTIKGISGLAPATRYFVDSNLSAATLGTIKLLNTDTSAAAVNMGFYALENPLSTKEIRSIKNTDKADKLFTWAWTSDASVPPDPHPVIQKIS